MDAYNFTQSTPATTWTITHNLNNLEPNIDVITNVSGVLTKTIPLEVVATDANTVVVTWTSNQIGTARLTA